MLHFHTFELHDKGFKQFDKNEFRDSSTVPIADKLNCNTFYTLSALL